MHDPKVKKKKQPKNSWALLDWEHRYLCICHMFANTCMIAVNLKETFEKFKDRAGNKKHKGVEQNTKGWILKVC